MKNIRVELSPTKLKQMGGGTYHKWLTARDKCGYQPIHIASQFGSLQFFEILWKLSYPGNLNFIHLNDCNGRDREELMRQTAFDNFTNDGLLSFSISLSLSLELSSRLFCGFLVSVKGIQAGQSTGCARALLI